MDLEITESTAGTLLPPKKLFAYCQRCRHSDAVNMRAVIERYGADFPLPAIRTRLRCSVCGGRNVDIRLGWEPRKR